MTVKPIPDGYRTVTPYLLTPDAGRIIEFAKEAFGAVVTEEHKDDKGRIQHAAMRIGDSMVMLGQANDKFPSMQSMLHLYVPDVDAVYAKAVKAGGKSLREPTDEFYGDRSCGVVDPGGNQWWIATHVEDVPPEEMERRAAAAGR